MRFEMTEETESICLVDACIEGSILYAAGYEWNILLEYDIERLELKQLGRFDGFQFPVSVQICAIYKYEEKLFCFSKNSYEVAEFDLISKRFKYYCSKEGLHKQALICSTCRVGDEIWMFREAFDPLVMVFSMRSGEYFRYPIDIRNRGKEDKYMWQYFESSINIGSQIWRCVPGSSDLIVLDTKKLESRVIKTNLDIPFLAMSSDDEVLYILSMDGKYVVKFDVDTNETTVYETGYTGTMDWPFRQGIKIETYFFLLPCFEQTIVCYEIKEREMHFLKRLVLPKEFKKVHDIEHKSLFLGWKIVGNHLYLLPFGGNGLLCIELDSLHISYFPIKISEQDYFAGIIRRLPLMYEEQMDLGNYLKGISCDFKNKSQNKNEVPIKTGKGIWEEIKTMPF